MWYGCNMVTQSEGLRAALPGSRAVHLGHRVVPDGLAFKTCHGSYPRIWILEGNSKMVLELVHDFQEGSRRLVQTKVRERWFRLSSRCGLHRLVRLRGLLRSRRLVRHRWTDPWAQTPAAWGRYIYIRAYQAITTNVSTLWTYGPCTMMCC